MGTQESETESLPLPALDVGRGLDMEEWELHRTAHAVKAMAHPLRLRLLCLIGTGEVSVQDLTNRVDQTSQSNVSQHLAQTLERGVLGNRKRGNQVLYRIRDRRVLSLMVAMRSVFCHESH